MYGTVYKYNSFSEAQRAMSGLAEDYGDNSTPGNCIAVDSDNAPAIKIIYKDSTNSDRSFIYPDSAPLNFGDDNAVMQFISQQSSTPPVTTGWPWWVWLIIGGAIGTIIGHYVIKHK